MKLPKIKLPKPKSHKGENGRLLIIAGSEKYHGSLLYAVKAASRIVDLIYVLSSRENLKLIQKLRFGTAEFIPVPPNFHDRESLVRAYDAVLIGPGMGVSRYTYNLVKKVLQSRVKVVLDADALNVMDTQLKKLLHPNCILTPHRGEFARLFRSTTELTIVKSMVLRYGCTILLKSPDADVIASPGRKVYLNYTGNKGMTKGGTGDVLAGLVAGLFTKNDAHTSAIVGAYVNGKAGDDLYKKVGVYYDAEDLVDQIPKTLWKAVK
ncbi:MAG: NAD(P)H-hydrate dehydratase [Candidatus Doudnabacteria bacterium RIFCSPHIGHO2_01_FULL_49_9]|uniref:ADP-dependent (S)-NAD(P)H-hydrate dehydratase n=1 Tax=Candidatus Doudnabacteria bacterium RIFCSPHIGHO2_01_FULL_49_9 TaxID=1817827 RepID=A0A1F5P2B8_9BACT|nr:MAG: NAD(P)H-hydrate dehydratase [Candidatus Doudnabacteria bacterium RIFCSPHIGHO2_01_FULL_49_9]